VARVHPSAVVDPRAKLADDVSVGPCAVIDEGVELAPGVRVGAHAVVTGRTVIGPRTRLHPGCLVGGEPQIRGRRGEDGALVIGADNEIRELAVLHTGSREGGGCTRLGDHNYVMNGAHVGHDCQVGSHCVLSSFTALGGHVQVEDHAVLGAYTGVHQHTRVGESAFTAGSSKITKDVLPFSRVAGDRARWVGLNTLGLTRRGFAPDTIALLKHAFHLLFHSKLRLGPAAERVRRECGGAPEVARLLAFLARSGRGVVR
jgi:UDP-N-acetylglucosamine acyltransferase